MLIRPYHNKTTDEAAFLFEFLDLDEFYALCKSLENMIYYIGSCMDEKISDSKEDIELNAISLLKDRLKKDDVDPNFEYMSILNINEASIFMTDILQANTIMLAAALTERNSLETQIAELNNQYRLDMFSLFEEWASERDKKNQK